MRVNRAVAHLPGLVTIFAGEGKSWSLSAIITHGPLYQGLDGQFKGFLYKTMPAL